MSTRHREPGQLKTVSGSEILLFPSHAFPSLTSASAGGRGTKEDLESSSEFGLLSGIEHF